MWEWAATWTWIGRVADVASLVALPASLYAAWKVRSIARRFVFRVRAATILEKLEDVAGELRQAIDSSPSNSREVRRQVRRCSELVQIVAKQSGADERRIAGRLARLADQFDRAGAEARSGLDGDVIWRIVDELDAFLIVAKDSEENRRVGGADVG